MRSPAGAALKGKVKGTARRAMTAALAIRLIVLMALMPARTTREVMAALLGDLPLVPWHRPYQVPDRERWRAPGGRRSAPRRWSGCGTGCWPRSTPSTATMTGGPSWSGALRSVLDRRVADPRAGHAGATGRRSGRRAPPTAPRRTRSCGSCCCSIASTRAALARGHRPVRRRRRPGQGRGRADAAGQALVKDSPHVFTPDRLWVMDRNFPGVPRIKALLATGTHVLIRVKDGITLHPHRRLPARRVAITATSPAAGARS